MRPHMRVLMLWHQGCIGRVTDGMKSHASQLIYLRDRSRVWPDKKDRGMGEEDTCQEGRCVQRLEIQSRMMVLPSGGSQALQGSSLICEPWHIIVFGGMQ